MGDIYSNYGTNMTRWTNAINQSLTNHLKIITNLYDMGVRTLIMPNAVDIMKIPQFDNSPLDDKAFIRQRIVDFNAAFATLLSNTVASLPGLKILEPDVFTLLDNVLAQPASYGLTNALQNGQSVSALDDNTLTDKSLNGPGTNYIFWDQVDPTAKFHAILADITQQLISPVQISKISSLNGSNRLDIVNIPIGLNGFVERSTNLVNWTTATNIVSTNATRTIFVPATGPTQFYRLRFPFSWSWP